MYKLVFLLVFSATTIMAPEPKLHVMVDIYFKTAPAIIQFGIEPAGTIRVSEGQEIQFHAQSTTTLYEFWCKTANEITILHPTLTFVSYDGEKQKWTLGGPIMYSKTVINNKLYCFSQIKEPAGLKVNAQRGMADGREYIQGEFELEFQSTETVQANSPRNTRNNVMPSSKEELSQPPNPGSPRVSLTIPQLGNEWTWINEHQSRKKYRYKFVEGETTINCSLNNPTNDAVKYTISCYINGTSDGTVRKNKAFKISETTAIIKPKKKHILACNVTLKEYDKTILCSAVNKNPSGINIILQNEIELEHIPREYLDYRELPFTPGPKSGYFGHGVKAPSIFVNITDETNKLVLGNYSMETYKQEYQYHFKVGEEVKIKCEVNTAAGYEKYKYHYGVTLQIDKKEIWTKNEPFISRTLRLEKDDEVLRCNSWNRKGSSIPGAPVNPQSIVYLFSEQPEPSENTAIADQLELTIGGLKYLQKGEFSAVNSTQMYNFNFTDGDFIKVSCNAKGIKKIYNLAFYLDGNLVGEFKEVTFIEDSFKLEKSSRDLMCVAWDKETNRNVTHVIQLHSIEPDLIIRGIRGMQKGHFFAENSTLMYDYQFTNGEIIKLLCYSKTAKTFNLAFYLDTKLKAEGTSSLNQEFTLNKDNRQIKCIALDETTKRTLETHVVRLHHNTDAPPKESVAPTVDLNVGPPEIRCVKKDQHNLEKICNYTYNDPALISTTISLFCTLSGNKDTYFVNFGTSEPKKVKAADTQRTISKEISLTGKNETEICEARRFRTSGFNFSVYVHIYYIPPPPTTTEPSTTSTEKLTTQTTVTTPLETTPVVQNADAVSTSENAPNPWWLKFAVGGGVAFITLCVVFCFVYFRRKKPPPDDSTYANLAKDQTSYQTLPVAAPRILKPGAMGPKVTVNGNYSEPKDSQDMSEALYADPNRFNGSDTYAEPYVKLATKPKSDYSEPYKSDYAEPYLPKSDGGYAEIVKPEGNYAAIGNSEGNYAAIGNSEGNYAEIGKNSDNKELYAKPIPKAQRPVKVKDDSNYSNVFTEQYANTKK